MSTGTNSSPSIAGDRESREGAESGGPFIDPDYRWLNYHHLYYFWCVAREGTIAQASLKLRLTRQAVGLQVQQFERAVGCRLLRRRGRRFELTEAGQMVHRYADEIFGLGRELMDALGNLRVERPSRLVVGVLASLPRRAVQRLVAPLMTAGRELHLSFREDKLDPLLAALASHELDLVLSDAPAPPGGPLRLYSHLLGESAISLLATRELAAKLAPDLPRSLDGAPLLMPGPGSMQRVSLDHWLRAHRVRPRLVAEFDDSQLMIDFGREGGGLFPVPGLVEEELLAGMDVTRVTVIEGAHDRFYALTRSRTLKHPAVIELLRAARETLEHPERR